MPDDVRIMCPRLTCRKILAVPESARGKVVRCRACGTAIRVPGGTSGTPSAPRDPKVGASEAQLG